MPLIRLEKIGESDPMPFSGFWRGGWVHQREEGSLRHPQNSGRRFPQLVLECGRHGGRIDVKRLLA
jgi:hypothetical protein